jgi:hypothetical protein
MDPQGCEPQKASESSNRETARLCPFVVLNPESCMKKLGYTVPSAVTFVANIWTRFQAPSTAGVKISSSWCFSMIATVSPRIPETISWVSPTLR